MPHDPKISLAALRGSSPSRPQYRRRSDPNHQHKRHEIGAARTRESASTAAKNDADGTRESTSNVQKSAPSTIDRRQQNPETRRRPRANRSPQKPKGRRQSRPIRSLQIAEHCCQLDSIRGPERPPNRRNQDTYRRQSDVYRHLPDPANLGQHNAADFLHALRIGDNIVTIDGSSNQKVPPTRTPVKDLKALKSVPKVLRVNDSNVSKTGPTGLASADPKS